MEFIIFQSCSKTFWKNVINMFWTKILLPNICDDNKSKLKQTENNKTKTVWVEFGNDIGLLEWNAKTDVNVRMMAVVVAFLGFRFGWNLVFRQFFIDLWNCNFVRSSICNFNFESELVQSNLILNFQFLNFGIWTLWCQIDELRLW